MSAYNPAKMLRTNLHFGHSAQRHRAPHSSVAISPNCSVRGSATTLTTQDLASNHAESRSCKGTAEQKAKWDDHAETYADCILSSDPGDHASKQVLEAITKHRQLPAGSRVLDLASSFGRPAVPLARELPHVSVVSTDLSPVSALLVYKYAAAQGVTNITAQAADAQDLADFSSNSFAAVTCTYGFMLMPDLDRALQEANRVLQPGGLLVATVWAEVENCQNAQAFQGLAKALMGPEFSFTPPWPLTDPHELQQHIQAANFEDVKCAEYSHNFQFRLDDFVRFMVGPHSQLTPMLNKLQAAGNRNVYQQAAQPMDGCKKTSCI